MRNRRATDSNIVYDSITDNPWKKLMKKSSFSPRNLQTEAIHESKTSLSPSNINHTTTAILPETQKVEIENETLQIQVDSLIQKLSEKEKMLRHKHNADGVDWKSKYNQLKHEYNEYKRKSNTTDKTPILDTQHSEMKLFKKQLTALFGIIQGHLDFMGKQELMVNTLISKSTSPVPLIDAKNKALKTEKDLLKQILDISEMQQFLNDIILIENLFNSLYTAKQKKKQKTARNKYTKDIKIYENKRKPICDVASFEQIFFQIIVHIDAFKTLLQKVDDECKRQNIKVFKSSGASQKKIQRSFYKAFYVYSVNHKENGYKQMTDVLRCTFVFENFSDLYRCFAVIAQVSAEDDNEGILRCKDRFHPKKVPFGYRDLLINIYCPGSKIVCEIQLHHNIFYKHKSISHKVYKKARLFEKNGSNEAYNYADKHHRVIIGDKIYEIKNEEQTEFEYDTPRAWLKKWGLQQYSNQLIDKYGCDDVDDWMGLTQRTLRNFGFSENDAKKFEMVVKNMHNDPVLWLKRRGLERYAKVLMDDHGYHDINDWSSLRMNKLQKEMKFKPGHAWKFMRCVKERNAMSYDYKKHTRMQSGRGRGAIAGRPFDKKRGRGRERGGGRGKIETTNISTQVKTVVGAVGPPPPPPPETQQKTDD